MSVFALQVIASPEGNSLLAQQAVQWGPAQAAPGEQISLFADWAGAETVDGLTISAADGWRVVQVEAVRLGRNDRIPLRIARLGEVYTAEAREPLTGRVRFVVTLRPASYASRTSVSIKPATVVDDFTGRSLVPTGGTSFDFDVGLESRQIMSSGRALRLRKDRIRPLSVDPARVPDLASAYGFTASFWLKTVDRGKVVLSTWSGNERDDYPFEFVIDAGGAARVYTGLNGMHYVLGSSAPIADGSWHHVAYSVEFASGLAQMVVDGLTVDSRYLPNVKGTFARRLTVGARSADQVEMNGLIDEILVTPSSRTAEQIARMARIPVEALETEVGSVILDFESQRNLSILEGVDGEADLAPSSLVLHEPASDVVAEFKPGSVLLSWTIEAPEHQVVTVERSTDRFQFQPIHTMTIGSFEAERAEEREFYSFEDFVGGDSPIYFYRVRQEFEDGSVIQSQMIKIGVGQMEEPATIELMGNSPNPFSNSTEVYFRVLEPTSLRLSVWSVSGHLVETLASETRDAGVYRIPFEAGSLPSGTYFLRLETDRGVQTHKMIVRR